jgi:Glycine rich protein
VVLPALHRRSTDARDARGVSSHASTLEEPAKRRLRPRVRRVAGAACVAAVVVGGWAARRPDSDRVVVSFAYRGTPAVYVVPVTVCRVRIDLVGAAGGGAGAAGTPGLGGRVVATVTVAPGEVLHVRVGGVGGTAVDAVAGGGGWNGGGAGGAAADAPSGEPGRAGSGGGGATDVREGGDALGNRIVVAAGGGGGGGRGIGGPPGTGGGDGGATVGVGGLAAAGSANPATGGGGGTQTAGGRAGRNAPDREVSALGGALGSGGRGARGGVSGGGGGGGGLFGGGGGGAEFEWISGHFGAGHGGGGSSAGPPDAHYEIGVGAGPGRAEIAYATGSCGTDDVVAARAG